MTDPTRWLDERDPPAPASLRTMVDELLAATDPSAALPDRLAAAALRALERVAGRPSTRETAHTLLAADALLTYACEAAAEEGLDTLDGLTDALDMERFQGLLHRSA